MNDERINLVGRGGYTPVRLAGANITVEGGGGSWFWALLTGVRQFVEDDESNALFRYEWKEAYLDGNGVPQELSDGRSSGLIWDIRSYSSQSYGHDGYATLASPADEDVQPGSAGTPATVQFDISPITTPTATSWSILVGTGPMGSGAQSFDIGYQFTIDTSITSATIAGIPTDGSVFYVSLITSVSGGGSSPFVCYECRILPGAYAIAREELNGIITEQHAGPAGGVVDPTADPLVPLDNVLVRMFETDIGQGEQAAYVFELPALDWWGEIQEGGYSDCRYHVVLQRIANDDQDPTAKLVFGDRTGAAGITVTVTNSAEHEADTHNLAAGTIVRVHQTRGGTYPHVPRYWINTGGVGMGSGFTGSFWVVNDICFHANGCVSGRIRTALTFENGLLKSVDPWPVSDCP